MERVFDDVFITSPDRSLYSPFHSISLNDAYKKGWFVSAVFGGFAWIIKKVPDPVVFKSRCVHIKFNCDRNLAEKKINLIAGKKYLMYKELLKGKKHES